MNKLSTISETHVIPEFYRYFLLGATLDTSDNHQNTNIALGNGRNFDTSLIANSEYIFGLCENLFGELLFDADSIASTIADKLVTLSRNFRVTLEEISSGRYRTIYFERTSPKEFRNSLLESKSTPVFLDVDNMYQNLVRGVVNRRIPFALEMFQRARESVWASRIRDVEDCLLIVGRSHAKNKYGLADKLKSKGIELEIIHDY